MYAITDLALRSEKTARSPTPFVDSMEEETTAAAEVSRLLLLAAKNDRALLRGCGRRSSFQSERNDSIVRYRAWQWNFSVAAKVVAAAAAGVFRLLLLAAKNDRALLRGCGRRSSF